MSLYLEHTARQYCPSPEADRGHSFRVFCRPRVPFAILQDVFSPLHAFAKEAAPVRSTAESATIHSDLPAASDAYVKRIKARLEAVDGECAMAVSRDPLRPGAAHGVIYILEELWHRRPLPSECREKAPYVTAGGAFALEVIVPEAHRSDGTTYILGLHRWVWACTLGLLDSPY